MDEKSYHKRAEYTLETFHRQVWNLYLAMNLESVSRSILTCSHLATQALHDRALTTYNRSDTLALAGCKVGRAHPANT